MRINKYLLIGIGLVLLAGVFGGVSYFMGGRSSDDVKMSEFTAVFLKTGDLYFGKVSNSPNFGLKQPYVLQINNTSKENPVSVQRFNKVFWGPEDFISINRDEVVWTTRLRADSKLVETFISNPDLTPPAESAQNGASQAVPPAAKAPVAEPKQ
ncbi:MAG: hypothetical protein WCO21_01015 [bacterium]|nr:hypothetical protein [Candidatus Jorgensenbacteria bacterium]